MSQATVSPRNEVPTDQKSGTRKLMKCCPNVTFKRPKLNRFWTPNKLEYSMVAFFEDGARGS